MVCHELAVMSYSLLYGLIICLGNPCRPLAAVRYARDRGMILLAVVDCRVVTPKHMRLAERFVRHRLFSLSPGYPARTLQMPPQLGTHHESSPSCLRSYRSS